MESTGVYWRPIWNVLEDEGFRLLLVNPAQVKALAGRKSDGRDAQRIAEYLQDGRLDASFVPSAEVRQLRSLLRHRISLLEQRNEVHNQIRDLLETASVKLSSVVSDLMGVTGRRIVDRRCWRPEERGVPYGDWLLGYGGVPGDHGCD